MSHRRKSRVADLSGLMNSTGVTKEQLDTQCKEVHLTEISEHLIEYRKVGPRLGLTFKQIDEIERNVAIIHSSSLKADAVLKKWYTKNVGKGKATFRVLVNVALELEDGLSAREICKICASVELSSDEEEEEELETASVPKRRAQRKGSETKNASKASAKKVQSDDDDSEEEPVSKTKPKGGPKKQSKTASSESEDMDLEPEPASKHKSKSRKASKTTAKRALSDDNDSECKPPSKSKSKRGSKASVKKTPSDDEDASSEVDSVDNSDSEKKTPKARTKSKRKDRDSDCEPDSKPHHRSKRTSSKKGSVQIDDGDQGSDEVDNGVSQDEKEESVKKELNFCVGDGEELEQVQQSGAGSQKEVAHGSVRLSKRWDTTRFRELKVHFLNPEVLEKEGWTCGGKNILTTDVILSWATIWNLRADHYPKLVDMEAKREEANIRVFFDKKVTSWSRVGNSALYVDKTKPTMVLNLYNMSQRDQRSMVLHEFGHALGLDHEHQRSDFWGVLESVNAEGQLQFIIGKQKMMTGNKGKCLPACKAVFREQNVSKSEQTEYDPQSIMHYWFDKNWLHEDFRDVQEVRKAKELSAKEKKVLEGVHARDYHNGQLAKDPSDLDYKALNDAYSIG